MNAAPYPIGRHIPLLTTEGAGPDGVVVTVQKPGVKIRCQGTELAVDVPPTETGQSGWAGSEIECAWVSAAAASIAAHIHTHKLTPIMHIQHAGGVSDDEFTQLVCELGLSLHSQRYLAAEYETVHVHTSEPVNVEQILSRWRTVIIARDLAGAPANLLYPARYAHMVAELVDSLDTRGELSFLVKDEDTLRQEGFGGILAVGQGSAHRPLLMQLNYVPPTEATEATEATEHIVLVGKGITFDTGGISIKPAANMHMMRTDMAGSAAVVSAWCEIVRNSPQCQVTALIPSAENMVSGSAFLPGDVITHYGGRTSFVVNTDAEGRMVLADALAYACKQLNPSLIVDVATLTGAAKLALGMECAALFTNSAHLAETFAQAGAKARELWWHMPITAATRSALDNPHADVAQCPQAPGASGAAAFLQSFVTEGIPWIHCDIAGPARSEDTDTRVNGIATGFAAATLATYVLGR